MGATGLERGGGNPYETSDMRTSSCPGGALSGAGRAESGTIDPDLQRLIDAWSALPAAIRAAIMALVQAGKDEA